MAKPLRGDELVGRDTDGSHRFHQQLRLSIPAERRPALPDDRLLEMDQNIVADSRRLNEARLRRGERPVEWLYFQYLALLFTEIYVDRFLRDPARLLSELDAAIEGLNSHLPATDRIERPDPAAEAAPQLNQIAFWMATGSGKTLLMHAHLRQFQRLLVRHGRADDLNRILLLTPNEGLSRQHVAEFRASGIPAALFDKERPLLHRGQVEIVEVSKLADEMGKKTVAVAAFEGNNLVLVDEGHRGASSGKEGQWMRHRAELCEQGFSFEYSATFGQAVKGNRELIDQYARSTLFDYSYRWFHGDGFGKDYRIFNLEGETADDWRDRYLLGALLTFFRQQWLYIENDTALRPFNLERPLWVFVGGSVTSGASTKDISDVEDILRFLDRTLRDREGSASRIAELLGQGLVTRDGRNLFPNRFAPLGQPLEERRLTAKDIFDRVLNVTFNAPGGGALVLERLKGAPGEVALRVGENDPFGVVNVGDPGKLLKRCEKAGIPVRDSEFGGSLFDAVNRPESTVHVVVGAKKFTEGWNSWRVSSMGLMNVGRSEGAQIIQMFGRGVRLKGRGMSLKRSSAVAPADRGLPACLPLLETLQVFGVRASYMVQFRDFLKDEGLEAERAQIFLPVKQRSLPSDPPLQTIRLQEAIAGAEPQTAFRRLGPRITLRPPRDLAYEVRRLAHPVVLNCYPKVRALGADGGIGSVGERTRQEANFTPRHVAALDLDALYVELTRFKAERGWHNLTVSRQGLKALLADQDWYRLQIPSSEMCFDDWGKVGFWQETVSALLRKYAALCVRLHREAWEAERLEYGPLTDDDPNLQVRGGGAGPGYRIEVESEDLKMVIEEMKTAIEEGSFRNLEAGALKAVRIAEHLYWPLLWVDQDSGVQVAPPALNEGEFRFVQDLRRFCEKHDAELRSFDLHLIRNQSRGRGVGFFEARNFHPDFILWAVEGRRQRIAFIDPKGLVHLGPDHEKVNLHRTIKETEQRLGDPNVQLDSFIVSVTRYADLGDNWTGLSRPKLADRHVLFQEDERYIGEILTRIGVPVAI